MEVGERWGHVPFYRPPLARVSLNFTKLIKIISYLFFFFFWSQETYLSGAAASNQEQPETVLVE